MFSSVGGFRFIQMGGLNSGLYFIGGTNDIAQGYVDNFGNTFFTGSSSGSNGNIVTAQINVNDVFISQKELTGNSTVEFPNALQLDMLGNVYIAGATAANSVGSYDMYVSKYDSSSNITWQKTIGTSSNDRFTDILIEDGNSNVFVTGFDGSDTSQGAYIAKLNASTGNIVSQIKIGGSVNAPEIAKDTQGNIYLTANDTSSGGNDGFIIEKRQGDFTHIFTKRCSSTSFDVAGGPIAIDSNRNIYISAYTGSSGGQMYMMKLNSSGVLQWEKTFNYSYNLGIESICVDTNNNIYVCGTFGSGTTLDPYILGCIKFDSSGNMLWQRGLNGYGGTQDTRANTITWKNNKLLISGYAYYSGTRYGLLLSVSDNGGQLGTLADGFIWGNGPFTMSDSTNLTVSSHVDNSVTASLSAVDGTLTNNTVSLTQIVIGGI